MRGLYLVTPNWDDTQRLLEVTEAALAAGAGILQYRHKSAQVELRYAQAAALQNLCRKYGVPFIINDFVQLAAQLNADGVHLGGSDISVAQARAILGKNKIIGASCYGDLGLAHLAQLQGANYVAFGGFYPSQVKQYAVTTHPDIVSIAKKEISLRQVVIGGMTVDLARPLVARGCDMVAAISHVYLSDRPADVVRDFIALFQ
ncbi:thiamine phosphate synthase [Undibacterium sp. FT137W]|uniref:Thiamine-phosphate synthase n=1 Tax=Undibacterium fentianense TaxID=2828728 RepID=A0A941E216_9BURK|nr:thiamine phosphate synthase [Undibacterium fentianense]